MKINEMDWEGDNNVIAIFEGNPPTTIGFTIDNINQLKQIINQKNTRFINIMDDISINLEKVKVFIYKEKSKAKQGGVKDE